MMLRNWKHWHEPNYWRWWWRHGASRETRAALATGMAAALLLSGLGTAFLLARDADLETITVQVVKTLGAQRAGQAPEEMAPLTPPLRTKEVTDVVTMFETMTRPGATDVVTVRRKGRTVVVRKPGEAVTHAVTVPGPLRERVVTKRRTDTVVQTQTDTTDRLVTVSRPGPTETVSRTVTERSPTVTERSPTVTERSPTVTERSTVTQTNVVTVDRPVTVTEKTTVTQQVTVTVTVKGHCTAPPCS